MKKNEIIVDFFSTHRKDLFKEALLPENRFKRFFAKAFGPMVTISWGRKTVRVHVDSIGLAERIYKHIANKWPEGLGYNALYTCFTAQEHGLLDENFEPCDGGKSPMSRMQELNKLGGHEAIKAYRDTMNT